MSEPIRIRPFHTTEVDLEGRPLKVRIARFTVGHLSEYSRLEAAMTAQREDRLLLVRRTPEELERITPTDTQADEHRELLERVSALEAKADGERDAFVTETFALLRSVVTRLTPVERYRIPDDEIRRRRDQDLTPEQRVELEQYRKEEADAAEAFMRYVIGEFVSIAPGQLEFEDADTGAVTPITSGADVLAYFGGQVSFLRQLMQAVRRENLSTEEEKKAWRSRSASTRSSAVRDLGADGPRPDATAEPAASEASAASAAATASTETSPSGAMATTSS